MEKKTYYIYYPRDFANEYVLMYTQNEADVAALPKGSERIYYSQAAKFCADENRRRRHNPAFSGYASNTIVPASYDWTKEGPLENGRHFRLVNYTWIRVQDAKPQRMCGGEPVRAQLYHGFSKSKKEA